MAIFVNVPIRIPFIIIYFFIFIDFYFKSGICCAKLVLRCAKPHTWAWLAQKIGWHSDFILPLAPLTFVLGAQKIGGFHPCNILHKCAKFGHWGYFNFWGTVEQRNRLEEKEKEKKEKEKTTEQKENIYALFHRHR